MATAMSPAYAGIGSRRAPGNILLLCERIADLQRRRGRILRSGHAIGCDQAFEAGACTRAELFLPWRDYEMGARRLARHVYKTPSVEAMRMVSHFHPTPSRLSHAVVLLHARNVHIILGLELDSPVERVVCWTPNELSGGTAFGLRVAREHGIPIDNLNDHDVWAKWRWECHQDTENRA